MDKEIKTIECDIRDLKLQEFIGKQQFKFELYRIAEALASQVNLFNCTYEVAWENYMHPLLTEQVSFQEVMNYINEQIKLTNDLKGL